MKAKALILAFLLVGCIANPCVDSCPLPQPVPTLAEFLAVGKPGDCYRITSGTWTGPESMIYAVGLKGTAEKPIVIKAAKDGAVTIDGEGKNVPIVLDGCEYVIVEGINACNSSESVVGVKDCVRCVVRRVCAWEAGPGNHKPYQIYRGEGNLIEDCAGWGRGRKIFAVQATKDATFRRCWGRWEGSTSIGPKMVFTAAYNSYGTLLDTCIGTWDARQGKVDQPYAIFGVDRNDGSKDCFCCMKDCVAYIRSTDRCETFIAAFFVNKLNHFEVVGCSAFVVGDLKPFMLGSVGEQVHAEGLYVDAHELPYVDNNWGTIVFADAPKLPAKWPMNHRIKALAGEDVEGVLKGLVP